MLRSSSSAVTVRAQPVERRRTGSKNGTTSKEDKPEAHQKEKIEVDKNSEESTKGVSLGDLLNVSPRISSPKSDLDEVTSNETSWQDKDSNSSPVSLIYIYFPC